MRSEAEEFGERRRPGPGPSWASGTFDPLPDAIDYGRHLLPLVRAELAARSAASDVVEGRVTQPL